MSNGNSNVPSAAVAEYCSFSYEEWAEQGRTALRDLKAQQAKKTMELRDIKNQIAQLKLVERFAGPGNGNGKGIPKVRSKKRPIKATVQRLLEECGPTASDIAIVSRAKDVLLDVSSASILRVLHSLRVESTASSTKDPSQ